MGKNLQNIINYSKKEGYINFSDNLLGDLSNIEDKDSILIIQDDREAPYASINKIINNYDKFIKLRSTDTVVFAEPKYDSNEKIFVKVENDLARSGCSVYSVPKDKNILHHASSEDLMIMIDLIKPKYYIPVKGEYRYMVNNANLASELGMPNENIILKQNGEVIQFENGKHDSECFDKIRVNDILIDGKSNEDVGELVIKDREMLSENGIVLISATVSKKEKILLVGPEVTTRGFIYVKDSAEMIEEIKRISLTIIERNITNNYIDFNNIKNEIREELGRYLYKETECKPMIIAVVQEV
jgi:ribonuclease J